MRSSGISAEAFAVGLRRSLWLVAFGLGCVLLSAPSKGGSSLSASDGGSWFLILGASLCVQALAREIYGSGSQVALPRLGCAIYALIAWSQLSIAVLSPALMRLGAETWGGLGCAIAAYAAVAVMELRAIYWAAHDAWSHAR